MDPLQKAREITEVRRQYEAADTKQERIRLARLLESLYTHNAKGAEPQVSAPPATYV